jgi:hypothetical protein
MDTLSQITPLDEEKTLSPNHGTSSMRGVQLRNMSLQDV